MKLSKLHIAGFKSFPDRAELGFDNGVTAIVGPNGCGKSNVVDAITWVLGEQSAKSLRGERMEDVIFNGSDARKPTATAEVRLKFTQVTQVALAVPQPDDLDPLPRVARDVEIGRRLYRSGESEYLIDGEACRLRDIHDLLMDSGLGVKAYAVIEQGKIGQILSSRPAERRVLIEEAAGVTKYKSRRRAAELKLEAAQLNLTRIDDIIFEVEKQRGALKRQAARARRYRKLREELRKWEQVQFARRYGVLAKEIEVTEARWQQARTHQTAAEAHVAELETSLEGLRLGLVDAESRANEIRERTHAREIDIERRQQQIQFGGQQIEELARGAQELAIEVEALTTRRGPGEESRQSQRAAAQAARAALSDVAARLSAREHDYRETVAGVQQAEQESDATRAAVLASTTTLAALRQARDHAATVRDRVAAELERLATERRDLAAEVSRASGAHDAGAEALRVARESHARLTSERASAETRLVALRGERAEIVDNLGARQRALASDEGRLRSLEELEASRATFGDAARFLLAEAGDALHQYGAVADHLVVERSFERAVDALLGELLQHVLVETPADAAAALKLLNDHSAGRCGFLILSEALRGVHAQSPLVVPPGARTLDSMVHATGPHAKAVLRLLGPALVVKTFGEARDLSGLVSVPIAASTGEVFRGSWLVQGGSRVDVRGILESRAEVLDLREEVAIGVASVTSMTARVAALAASIAKAEHALAVLVTNQHDHEKTIVGLDGQVTRAIDERQRLSRRLEVVQTEWSRAEEEQRGADNRREDATRAIAAHEQLQRDAELNLAGVSTRLQIARDDAEARLRLVTESRAEEAGLVERVSALEAEAARLDEAARELEDRIGGTTAEVERNALRSREIRASVRESERLLDEDVRALESLRVNVREVDDRLTTLRGEFGERDHGLRAARHALDGVRAEVMQAEVARVRASSDLTHLGAACLEAVGASLDEVVASTQRMEDAGELVPPDHRVTLGTEEDDDIEGVGEEASSAASEEDHGRAGRLTDPDDVIALFRKRIDRLGPVNMMAIEQFDELETRHTFLTTQRQDLLQSIAQTGEAIQKIDKTTRERFAEAFESINRNFEQTFTTLFGGGRAGLVLIDHENDAESGIDIIAQPPGKRLQNVQLLSGGEKALTAMALMFAIFKHRPSPFCLLDEIDAPLDDANIGRFVEMLQGMQEHTQFILITHNRKTMEIANRLYGVTMEEPGVSKLISVQLN